MRKYSLNSDRAHLPDRRGTTLVGVLACLVVGTLITGLTVQSALRGRREARLERQRLQTEWLVEGGIVRAANALRASNEYDGETWHPELNIEPLSDAVVEIKVKREQAESPSTDTDNKQAKEIWTVQVVARLDSTTDNDGPMQRSGSLVIEHLSQNKPSSETKSETSE